MVGLKVAEGNKGSVSPSPKKKDKKMKKLKGNDSPQVGKIVSSPSKSTNGTVIQKEPSKPAKPSDGAVQKKDKKKKNFGKFGKRNAMKVKNNIFTKMVKEEAVKENLSPMFLKKLDKSMARLPDAGKRFVQWLVHDVKYKIKFLPVIEEVFKLIKDMKVLPLPSGGKAPKTNREKRRERQKKRNELKAAGLLGNSTPKKPEGNAVAPKNQEQKTDGSDNTPKKGKKRTMSEVSPVKVGATPESGKKKKKTKTGVTADNSSDFELADVFSNAGESNVSASEKKKKRKKSFGKMSSN